MKLRGTDPAPKVSSQPQTSATTTAGQRLSARPSEGRLFQECSKNDSLGKADCRSPWRMDRDTTARCVRGKQHMYSYLAPLRSIELQTAAVLTLLFFLLPVGREVYWL